MKHILITGGDSYLGFLIAQKYLALTDDVVHLWLRADSPEAFADKQSVLQRKLSAFGNRVKYSYGDLHQETPFEMVCPESIHVILHSAAVTRFNVEPELALQVNVEGTEKLLTFANQCPSLEAVGLLSSVYASGLKTGPVEEVRLMEQQGFSNQYELSKWAAEEKLFTDYAQLPWRVFRVATAISDDNSGRVMQYNAVHNTLQLLFYGLMSLVPGKPETPLYFVTGDFCASAVFHLMNHAPLQNIYHVCHSQENSITLGDLIDIAFETFEQDADFKCRRILKPLYCDEEAFKMMVEGVTGFGGSIVNQALASVSPFARQLYISKDVKNDNLVHYFDNYQAPDPRQLVQSTCRYLAETRWGRQVSVAT